MKKDLVSIITPVYNGGKYVGQTIRSVLNQTYPNWEMLIVNDGSKDNSEEIILEFAKTDSRIKYIKQPNGGSASARNNGLREAQGQYIALLDADDLWDPTFLEEQIAYMKKNHALLVHCGYRRINEINEEILTPCEAKSYVGIKDMERTNYIACLTGLYDSSKFGKVFLHEELRSIRDDYAYWLDIVKIVGASYGNPKILASYRVLANSTTGNKKKLIKSQYKFYRIYQNFGILKSLLYTAYWGYRGFKKFRN